MFLTAQLCVCVRELGSVHPQIISRRCEGQTCLLLSAAYPSSITITFANFLIVIYNCRIWLYWIVDIRLWNVYWTTLIDCDPINQWFNWSMLYVTVSSNRKGAVSWHLLGVMPYLRGNSLMSSLLRDPNVFVSLSVVCIVQIDRRGPQVSLALDGCSNEGDYR